MTFADDCTRVYAAWGKMAHLLAPLESPSGGDLLCRRQLRSSFEWLGTGSQDEYDKAASLPLCSRCARAAAVQDDQAPASPPSPLGDDAGPDGAEVEHASLAPAPGRASRPASRGTAGLPSAPLEGRPAHAPSPPLGDSSNPQGGPGGEGHDPASAGKGVPALAGQDWRDAVRREKTRQARGQRNLRGRRTTAPREGPGMIRREPPGGGDAA